jgi:dihydrofolate synthase/folylpolyglutamate synthase
VNEEDAVAALQARGRFGVKLGLGRTKALLEELGNPQERFRGALIGGTNGKGSVQSLVVSALRAAGVVVGQTPKPHLVSYRERIVVDGEPIGSNDFGALIEEVVGVAERIPGRLGPATEFELVTAAAYAWFARRGIDVGVIEVGLGGRLDATNVWDGGVAAITNVDLDHMEWLGPTIPLIAREKAAIIKRGDLAVTGADGEGLEVITAVAKRSGAPLTITAPLPVSRVDRLGTVVRDFALGELRVGLIGRHQAANAAVALGVLGAIERRKIAAVPGDAIRTGFADAAWPGRMELLELDANGTAHRAGAAPSTDRVDLLLDGAHNAAGAAALAQGLDDLRPNLAPGRATLVFGALRDKQVERMVEALRVSALVRDAGVIAVTVPGTERALPATDVAAAWRAEGSDAETVTDANDGFRIGLERARTHGGPLLVAGSLYLVGAVRGTLFGKAPATGA